jgi:hypothetical protein
MYKDRLNFVAALLCMSYTLEKVDDPDNNYNYYEAEIEYRDSSFLKVIRFSETINSYVRFHNHTIRKSALEKLYCLNVYGEIVAVKQV